MLFTFFFYFDTAKIYTFFYLPTILVGKCAIFMKIIFIITENQQLILTKKMERILLFAPLHCFL